MGKSLLKVVEAELIMATSRAWKRRELAAMELVFRRLQLYSKRFHTPVAKLRSQITALIADIESRKAAGATSKHLAVTYNLVEELRAKMATLVAQGAEGSSKCYWNCITWATRPPRPTMTTPVWETNFMQPQHENTKSLWVAIIVSVAAWKFEQFHQATPAGQMPATMTAYYALTASPSES